MYTVKKQPCTYTIYAWPIASTYSMRDPDDYNHKRLILYADFRILCELISDNHRNLADAVRISEFNMQSLNDQNVFKMFLCCQNFD